MALQDFLQKLKEQDDSDVIYSKTPEPAIKLIPPEKPSSQQSVDADIAKPTNNLRIIPPASSNDIEQKPTSIKFKLNIGNTPKTIERQVATDVVQPTPVTQPKQQPTQKSTAPQQPKKLSPEEQLEQLFLRSGTSRAKRDAWYEYYNKAKSSRKQNSVVERIRQGKFAITSDNQVLILPDYDTRKPVSDILKDKWL